MTEVTSSLAAAEAISAAGATAPRISVFSMEEQIVAKHVFNAADAVRALGQPVPEQLRVLTLCILVFKNGYTVVGKSASASPENFDAGKGAMFAYEDAIRQAWPLFGFALRDQLTLSEPLQAAIRNELAGLPSHREDVNATMVPALSEAPGEYTMARAASFGTGGLNYTSEEAWADVRAQIVAANPPFPRHMIGFTISEAMDGMNVLTVYA